MCTCENFTLGHAQFGVCRGMLNWEGKARRSIKSIMVAHKMSWERMCSLHAERGRKIVLITQIAFILLIAFVANSLLDQLYSLFSVSEHPLQAGSIIQ